jgi:hypothetical protein
MKSVSKTIKIFRRSDILFLDLLLPVDLLLAFHPYGDGLLKKGSQAKSPNASLVA